MDERDNVAMSTAAPICAGCRRLRKREFGDVLTCAAFPDRIPDDILDSRADHRKPHEGDHGLTFLPKSGKMATAAAEIIRLAQLPQPKGKDQGRRARAGQVTE